MASRTLGRAAFLVMLALGAAFAQADPKALEELNHTDRVIARIAPLVEKSSSAMAAQLLGEATSTQGKAWAEQRAGRLGRASALTLLARRSARQAGALVLMTPDQVRTEANTTKDFLQRLGPILSHSPDAKVRELWGMAQGEQATAGDQLGKAHFGLAFKFTMAARSHLRTAYGLAGSSIEPGKVSAELDRTDSLLERARVALGRALDDQTRQLLANVQDWQGQARSALQGQMLGRALKFTLAARDLLLRTWGSSRTGSGPALLAQALDETDRLISNWSDPVKTEGPPEAKQALAQAVKLQGQARKDSGAGKPKSALDETSQARRLMNRAIELSRPEEPPPETDQNE